VLAVPVSALLALDGGGYGLEVVEPSGAHRLVGGHTGVFAGSQVQVAGPQIAAGTTVVVAQWPRWNWPRRASSTPARRRSPRCARSRWPSGTESSPPS